MKMLNYSFSGVQWLLGGCLLSLFVVILPAVADCSEFAVDDSDEFGHNSDCSYDTGLNRAVHKALNTQPEAESKQPESKPKLSTLGMPVKAASVERELLTDTSKVYTPKYSAMKIIELAPAASAQQLSQFHYQALNVLIQQCPQGFTVYAEKYAHNTLALSKNNNLKAVSGPDHSATSTSSRVGSGLQLHLVYQCD